MLRAHIFVSGLVTGVGFRSFVKNNVGDLKGFVRNMPNRKVEIVVEGYENSINKLLDKINEGPWGAKVEDVDVRWEEPTNKFKDFRIEA